MASQMFLLFSVVLRELSSSSFFLCCHFHCFHHPSQQQCQNLICFSFCFGGNIYLVSTCSEQPGLCSSTPPRCHQGLFLNPPKFWLTSIITIFVNKWLCFLHILDAVISILQQCSLINKCGALECPLEIKSIVTLNFLTWTEDNSPEKCASIHRFNFFDHMTTCHQMEVSQLWEGEQKKWNQNY